MGSHYSVEKSVLRRFTHDDPSFPKHFTRTDSSLHAHMKQVNCKASKRTVDIATAYTGYKRISHWKSLHYCDLHFWEDPDYKSRHIGNHYFVLIYLFS